MSLKPTTLFRLLPLFFVGYSSFAQTNSCDEYSQELVKMYKKIFPQYYKHQDSLDYYSDLFSTKFTDYIKNNPSTLDCKFKSLTDSNACNIVTTPDGLFRIYSWDTWLGGTMHNYKNLYQFKSKNKIYTTVLDYGEGYMGTYYTDIIPLSANGKNYFLAISGGSESTSFFYELIRVFSIGDFGEPDHLIPE